MLHRLKSFLITGLAAALLLSLAAAWLPRPAKALIGDTPTVHFGPVNVVFGVKVRFSYFNPSDKPATVNVAMIDTATGQALAFRKDVTVPPGGRLTLDYTETQATREVVTAGECPAVDPSNPSSLPLASVQLLVGNYRCCTSLRGGEPGCGWSSLV
ncbi:MAG: hypothetical protein HY235_17790 [Acidobacteria bacterium]|nr:hypothetical protein [Acidobacteriota bacterium]